MNKFFEGTKKSGPFPAWAGFACAFFAFWSVFTFSRQLRTGNEDLKLPAVFLGCLVPIFLFPVFQWLQIRLERTSDKRIIYLFLFFGAFNCWLLVSRIGFIHVHGQGKDFEYKSFDENVMATNVFLILLSFSLALASESANSALAGNVKLN